jgi:hypothetical protein
MIRRLTAGILGSFVIISISACTDSSQTVSNNNLVTCNQVTLDKSSTLQRIDGPEGFVAKVPAQLAATTATNVSFQVPFSLIGETIFISSAQAAHAPPSCALVLATPVPSPKVTKSSGSGPATPYSGSSKTIVVNEVLVITKVDLPKGSDLKGYANLELKKGITDIYKGVIEGSLIQDKTGTALSAYGWQFSLPHNIKGVVIAVNFSNKTFLITLVATSEQIENVNKDVASIASSIK